MPSYYPSSLSSGSSSRSSSSAYKRDYTSKERSTYTTDDRKKSTLKPVVIIQDKSRRETRDYPRRTKDMIDSHYR